MKFNQYFGFDPNKEMKPFDNTQLDTIDYGKGFVSVQIKAPKENMSAEGIIINKVFVGVFTICNEGTDKEKWAMVFNKLTRKDLKRIGTRFKSSIPPTLAAYGAASDEVLLEDWPSIYNNKVLKCEKQGTVKVLKNTGSIDHVILFGDEDE